MVNALETGADFKFAKFNEWNFVRRTKQGKTETQHYTPHEAENELGWSFVYAMKLFPTEGHALFGEYESFGEDLLFVEDFHRKKIGQIILLDDTKGDNMMVVKRVDMKNQENIADIPCGDCQNISLKPNFFDFWCSKLEEESLGEECKKYYNDEMESLLSLNVENSGNSASHSWNICFTVFALMVIVW